MNDMVTEGLMTAATRRLDLSIDDATVADFIRSRFVDATGQFERARYQTFLANNGWSEEQFVGRLRQDLARQQLVDALTAVPEAPAPLLDRRFASRGDNRKRP